MEHPIPELTALVKSIVQAHSRYPAFKNFRPEMPCAIERSWWNKQEEEEADLHRSGAEEAARTIGAGIRVSMHDAGFKHLACGFYANVYTHQDAPSYVFKVCLRLDDAYAAYVAWARMMQGTPHVPEIVLAHRSNGVFVVVLPKYERLKWEDCEFSVLDAWQDVSRLAADGLDEYIPSSSSGIPCGDFGVQYDDLTSLQQTALAIGEYFYGTTVMDMHEGNFMYDPVTAQVIITDPMSSSNPVGGFSFEEEQDETE